MSDRMRTETLIIMAVLLLVVVPASPCETPVWLFALDNWDASRYEIVVLHQGPLSSVDTKAVSLLKQNALAGPLHANIRVVTAYLDGTTDQTVKRLWEARREATLPWVVAVYPGSGRFSDEDGVRFVGGRQPVVAWSGALNESNVRALLDSSLRRDIARQLAKRVTAVWVLLESGNRAKDSTALKTLETELSRLERTLTIPSLFDAGTSEDIDIRITFSIVRVSRGDPAERALVEMLLNSEHGLNEINEPMVFPIFGRGIILYALVGRGINSAMIADAAEFLTGPCSCEVKALNPGVDMLMAVDWDNRLERLNLPDTPPPTGLTGFSARAEEAEQLLRLPEEKAKEETPSEPDLSRTPDRSELPDAPDTSELSDSSDQSDETAQLPESAELSDQPEPSDLPDRSGIPETAASTGGKLARNLLLVMLFAAGGIVMATLLLRIHRHGRAGE